MRNSHRDGRKQIVAVVSPVLHAQVKKAAAAASMSMQEWVVEALREKVSGDAGDVGAGVRRSAAPVGRFDGPDPFGVGEGAGGVGADRLVGAVEPPLFVVADELEGIA